MEGVVILIIIGSLINRGFSFHHSIGWCYSRYDGNVRGIWLDVRGVIGIVFHVRVGVCAFT